MDKSNQKKAEELCDIIGIIEESERDRFISGFLSGYLYGYTDAWITLHEKERKNDKFPDRETR